MPGAEVKQIPLEEVYKKNNGISPEDIKKLRDWLQTQPHLPADHITDLDVILAFNCCDRSAEVAKQLLDIHFTLKTLFSGYFQHRVVNENVLNVLSSIIVSTTMAMCSSVSVKQFPLEEEYKKDTGVTPEDVKKMREWLKTQPHLPEEHITDLDIILAYHSSDCSTAVARHLINTHYSLKTAFTDLFEDRVVDASIERVLNTILLLPMPTRTKEGYVVYFTHILDTDPRKYSMPDTLKTIIMSWELWQYETGTWPGFVMICDMAGFSLAHMGKFQLSSLQHYAYYLQEAFLAKLKQIHILNAPSFFDRVLSLCKPFIKSSLLDLLHIHTVGSRTLEEYYSVENLPKEAGGQGRGIAECRDEVIAKLRAGKEFFEAESKKRVTKRLPGAGQCVTNCFGSAECSFKKLDID